MNHLNRWTIWWYSSFLLFPYASSNFVNLAFSSEPYADVGTTGKSSRNTLMHMLGVTRLAHTHPLRSMELGITSSVTAFHQSISTTSGDSLKVWMYVMEVLHSGCSLGNT